MKKLEGTGPPVFVSPDDGKNGPRGALALALHRRRGERRVHDGVARREEVGGRRARRPRRRRGGRPRSRPRRATPGATGRARAARPRARPGARRGRRGRRARRGAGGRGASRPVTRSAAPRAAPEAERDRRQPPGGVRARPSAAARAGRARAAVPSPSDDVEHDVAEVEEARVGARGEVDAVEPERRAARPPGSARVAPSRPPIPRAPPPAGLAKQSARPSPWSRAHGCAGIRAAHPCRPRNQGPAERTSNEWQAPCHRRPADPVGPRPIAPMRGAAPTPSVSEPLDGS